MLPPTPPAAVSYFRHHYRAHKGCSKLHPPPPPHTLVRRDGTAQNECPESVPARSPKTLNYSPNGKLNYLCVCGAWHWSGEAVLVRQLVKKPRPDKCFPFVCVRFVASRQYMWFRLPAGVPRRGRKVNISVPFLVSFAKGFG